MDSRSSCARSGERTLAPTGTPPAALERLSAEVAKALADADLAGRLAAQGTQPAYQNASEFGAFIAGERKRWAEVVRAAKITLD